MTSLVKRAMRELFGEHKALLSRDEAIKFWRSQMDSNNDIKYRDPEKSHGTSCYHYGNCELMALMDAIYGPDPKMRLTEQEARQTEKAAQLQVDIERWTS